MISVSDELKQAVIHEVKPKNIEITFDKNTTDHINWLVNPVETADFWDEASMDSTVSMSPFDWEDTANFDYVTEFNFISASFDVVVRSNLRNTNAKCRFEVQFYREGSKSYIGYKSDWLNVADLYNSTRVYVKAPTKVGTYNMRAMAPYIDIQFQDATIGEKSNIYFGRPQIDMIYGDYQERPYSELWATPKNIKNFFHIAPSIPIDNSHIISESFEYTESICSAENLKFGLCEASQIDVDVFDVTEKYVSAVSNYSMQYADIAQKFYWKQFVVEESQKTNRGNTQVRHIKALDRLKYLKENAYSWYSQYMFGVNMGSANPSIPYHFDYERQIFSTYWNLAKTFGVESYDYINETLVEEYDAFDCKTQDRYFNPTTSFNGYNRLHFCKKTITPSSAYTAYIVRYDPYVPTDVNKVDVYGQKYRAEYDKLMRGVRQYASVYVDFHCGNKEYHQLFDNGDCFVVPPNCTTFDIYIPYCACNNSFTDYPRYGDSSHGWYGLLCRLINVYGVTFDYYDPNELVNGYKNLVYHSLVSNPTLNDIFKASSAITARDVMRSLMEMCGCFYRLDREGHPQFLYASEHGLYPSNNLYPSDNLYPKKSGEMTMPTSYYIRADFAEYKVQKFGGVQVVINTYDNIGSAVRWEYWGDESSDNAYLIDDNIFLCSEQFEYESGAAGYVEDILESLYNVLDNMQYTPFTADTIGTPFLESGDRFTLLTSNDGFESFIFERKLKGIQALKDHFEARGVEKTPRVKNFEWED